VSILTPPCNRGIRGTDKYGSGAFGASRNGGTRWHLGVDTLCEPGDPVLMPADGVIVMHGIAYPDDPRFRTIRIQSSDETDVQLRILYVLPEAGLGTSWKRGERIATAQNIALKYDGILAHVHFEVRRNGVPIDPTKLLVDT